MNEQLAQNYLNEVLNAFRNYKNLADKSFAQISEAEFFRSLDEESNSIATVTKHLAGNFRSRWTDFLTTDGEKPDRHRDAEFVTPENEAREDLIKLWESGWQILLSSIESLAPEDLAKTVTIRGQAHTVVEALNRSVTHCAYHVGQIVFLAKHFRSSEWQTLSVPRNKSNDFNQYLQTEKGEQLNRFDAVRKFADESQKKP